MNNEHDYYFIRYKDAFGEHTTVRFTRGLTAREVHDDFLIRNEYCDILQFNRV